MTEIMTSLPPPESEALGPTHPVIDRSLPRPAPTLAYSWRNYNPDAKLFYLRDHEKANLELAQLRSATALGFDLEWKPTFFRGARENPVALVQLANATTIFLLQVTAMKGKRSIRNQALLRWCQALTITCFQRRISFEVG